MWPKLALLLVQKAKSVVPENLCVNFHFSLELEQLVSRSREL